MIEIDKTQVEGLNLYILEVNSNGRSTQWVCFQASGPGPHRALVLNYCSAVMTGG